MYIYIYILYWKRQLLPGKIYPYIKYSTCVGSSGCYEFPVRAFTRGYPLAQHFRDRRCKAISMQPHGGETGTILFQPRRSTPRIFGFWFNFRSNFHSAQSRDSLFSLLSESTCQRFQSREFLYAGFSRIFLNFRYVKLCPCDF